MLPTIDLRRLAGKVLSNPRPPASTVLPTADTAVVPPRPLVAQIPDARSDLRQALKSLVRGQVFDNVFLSTHGEPEQSLVGICCESGNVLRLFLWGRNPYPFEVRQDECNRVMRERQYPDWWSEKIEWLPEDIEAVPRVVDLFITDHSPWTLRFAQPRCCLLIGDAARAPRDEDYRWTAGDGWLLGHRCRPRSRQAMNYRTVYSMNGGAENEDPFGWY